MIDRPAIRNILIDEAIIDAPVTELVLDTLKEIPAERISNEEAGLRLQGKYPDSSALPTAKRTLLITVNHGRFLKPLDSSDSGCDPERSGKYRLDFIQGCPMDCRYCFCQSYLQCHHTVLFANVESIVKECHENPVLSNATWITGDVADSLCLGHASILLHRYLAEIFTTPLWELRTKLPLPSDWRLDPERVRLDWSLSPDTVIADLEPGTASASRRIEDVARVVGEGYRCGIRFDPIQPTNWRDEDYRELINSLKSALDHRVPDLFVIGCYKSSNDLKKRIRQRFPRSGLTGEEWVSSFDGKLRPFRSIRLESYRRIIDLIRSVFPTSVIHLSMEPDWIWKYLHVS
jgi:DNA repair photolyase